MYKQNSVTSVGNSVANGFLDAVHSAASLSRGGSDAASSGVLLSAATPMRRRTDRQGQAPATLLAGLLARAMDEVDYGMVLIDAQGMVCYTNSMARNDLEQGQLLQLESGRLVASSLAHRDALEAAVARATRGTRSLVEVESTEPGAAGVTLAVVPMGLGSDNASAAVPVLLISGKRRICEQISMQFFAQRHGLSRTEHVVLQALATGATVQEIADERGLALSTVRSQIKDIRVKTRCKSVRELLAMVSALPPMVSTIKRPNKG